MKTYILETVEYSFNRKHRKWEFRYGDNCLLIVVPGGKDIALAIAKQINASCKRVKQNKLDGLARKNIDNLTKVVENEEN